MTLKLRRIWTDVAIVAGLVGWTLANHGTLLRRIATHAYSTQGDIAIFTWVLTWNCRVLETGQWATYWASNAMRPYPYATAFSENMMGLAPLACPVWWLTRNPILTMNVTCLILVLLTAGTTFFVLRAVSRDRWAALVGTPVFAFYPWITWNLALGHAHIIALFPLPVVVYANWRYWQDGAFRWWLLLWGAFLWTFLISLYLGIILTFFLVLWTALWFLADRSPFGFRRVRAWLLGLGLAWLAMSPVLGVYYRVSRDMGAVRTLQHQTYFTGYAWVWLVPPPNAWLWYQKLGVLPRPRLPPQEDALFPGVLAVGLFGLSFALRGLPPWLRSLRWTGIVTALLALGPYASGPGWRVPAPYMLALYVYPPLWATRNPLRWSLPTMLVAGFLATAVGQRLGRRSRWTDLLRIGVVLGLAVETFSVLPVEEALHPKLVRPYRLLALRPEIETVVELPMPMAWVGEIYGRPIAWLDEPERLLASTYHWKKLINGLTGLWPPIQYQLGSELEEFPTTHSIRLLQALGVDTVLLHERRYGPAAPTLVRRLSNWPGIQSWGRVWSVSFWRIPPGQRATTLRGDTDLRLLAPSKLLAGRVTLGLEVPPACRGVVWNTRAPAKWAFPFGKAWRVRIAWDEGATPATELTWDPPALFHPRKCRFAFSAPASPGRHVLTMEVDRLGQITRLRRTVDVMPACPEPSRPPFLELPCGAPTPPWEALRVEIDAELPPPGDVQPGDMLEGDVIVRNPGPFYWRADPDRGVFIAARLICDGRLTDRLFGLPHDLSPGDRTRVRIFVPLPDALRQCSLYLNAVGQTGDGRRVWFPTTNWDPVWQKRQGTVGRSVASPLAP